MARNPEITRALSSTHEGFLRGLGDQVTEGSRLLTYCKMMKAFTKASGEQWSFAARLKPNANFQNFDANTIALRNAQNLTKRVYVDVKFSRITDSISTTDMIKNRGNAEKIFDLYDEKATMMIDDLGEEINRQLFKDNSSDSDAFDGLETIADFNNTYLGLDRTVDTFWAANEEDVASNFPTNGLPRLRAIVKSMTHSYTKRYPFVFFTTEQTYDNYEVENEDKIRIIRDDEFASSGLGFPTLKWYGSDFIWDKDCVANRIFCLRMGEGQRSPYQILTWLDDFVEGTEEERYVEAFNFGFQVAMQPVSVEPRGLGKIINTD